MLTLFYYFLMFEFGLILICAFLFVKTFFYWFKNTGDLLPDTEKKLQVLQKNESQTCVNESSSSACSANNAVNHSVKRAILSLYPNAKTTKGIFLRTKKREKKRRQKVTNSSIENSFNSTIINHYNRSSFIKSDNCSSSLSSYITPQSSINLPDHNESLFSEKDPVPYPLNK